MKLLKPLFLLLFILRFSFASAQTIGELESVKTYQEVSGNATQFAGDVNKEIAKIRAAYKKVQDENRFTEMLNMESVKDLPVSISKVIGGKGYDIIVDEIKVGPEVSYLSAAFVFVVPKSGDTIIMRAADIGFHAGGLTGDVKLYLLKTLPIKFSDKITLNLVADPVTHVVFDCQGFKSMSIKGEVDFSKELLVKDTPDGTEGTEGVKAYFQTVIPEWGDFIAQLTIEPFQVASLKGVGFQVSEATLDLSEVQTPGNVVFPDGYASASMLHGDRNMWEGFYMKQFTVRLPKQFKENDNSLRKELNGYNILIDGRGVSGSFDGKNLISLDKGDMNGWAFSVDSIGVSFVCNQIRSGGLKGAVKIPLGKETDKNSELGYLANIYSGDDYRFNISLQNTLDVPLWSAKLSLAENSNIDIRVQDGKFLPVATLHGKMSVNAEKVSLAQVEFQGLRIATQAPYLKIQAIALTSDAATQKMAGFPLTLKKIGFQDRGEYVGIGLEVMVKLTNSNDGDGGNAFAGSCGFTIVGKLSGGEGQRQKFHFHKLELDKIYVDADIGAVALKGQINFYRENAVYGSGFKGMLDITIIEKINIKATAQFGTVNNYRYWYFDGKLTLSTGIPIATGVALYGFGGGAYKHMKRDMAYNTRLPNPDENVQATDFSDEPGVTLSGIKYIPDQNIGFGLKASVIFGTMGSPSVINGEIGFEINFHSGGGINFVALNGSMVLLTDIKERDKPDPTVGAKVEISYYVPEKVFHAAAEVRFNVAGLIKGGGGIVMHFAPSDWYVYVGHPDSKINLELVDVFTIQSYFMVGTEIPAMPPLPDRVTEILGPIDPDKGRDLTSIKGGRGLCFGASVNFDTGKKTFLMFYGEFALGVGFDVMLKNFGPDVYCANTGDRPGVNGWYAMGQVYAYVHAAIGIQAKVLGKTGEFDILSLGAAVVFQGQLPKPTWLKGIVGGRYSILGGLLSGNCRFELEVGDKCQIAGGSTLANVQVISKMTPDNGSNDVSVFNAAQVAFNLPVENPFDFTDNEGRARKFRVKLDYLKLLDGTTSLRGTVEMNDAKDVIAFNAHDILPPKKNIKAEVSIYFEEFVNNRWITFVENGKRPEEKMAITFTTGEAPDYIPASNVAYSYPVIDQYNFLKGESPTAYITLKTGQPYLFTDYDRNKWKQKARYTPAEGGGTILVDFGYDPESRTLNIPVAQALSNSKVYHLEIVNLPAGANDEVDANVSESTVAMAGDQVQVRSKNLTGTLDRLQEKQLFGYHFKTSRFNTMPEKLATISFTSPTNWIIYGGISQLILNMNGPELLDKFDLHGHSNNVQRLVDFVSTQNNPWFGGALNPLMYSHYPIDGELRIKRRAESELGVPPLKAVYVVQTDGNKVVGDADIAAGTGIGISGYASLVYNLSFYAWGDYDDLKQQAAARMIGNYSSSAVAYDLVNSIYPNMASGTYEIEVKYTLPGTNKITSISKIKIVNP
jgi:hypothetical protein